MSDSGKSGPCLHSEKTIHAKSHPFINAGKHSLPRNRGLKGRRHRSEGKGEDADTILKPIIANPFNRTPIQAQIDKDLAGLPEPLEKALAQSAEKAACSSAARKPYTVCWYLEMSKAGVPGFTGYDAGPLEALWTRGLGELASRLDS